MDVLRRFRDLARGRTEKIVEDSLSADCGAIHLYQPQNLFNASHQRPLNAFENGLNNNNPQQQQQRVRFKSQQNQPQRPESIDSSRLFTYEELEALTPGLDLGFLLQKQRELRAKQEISPQRQQQQPLLSKARSETALSSGRNFYPARSASPSQKSNHSSESNMAAIGI